MRFPDSRDLLKQGYQVFIAADGGVRERRKQK